MWILMMGEKGRINENNGDGMNAFNEDYRSTDRTHHEDTAELSITYKNTIIEQTVHNRMTRTFGGNA
jgi:hypothetical protein